MLEPPVVTLTQIVSEFSSVQAANAYYCCSGILSTVEHLSAAMPVSNF